MIRFPAEWEAQDAVLFAWPDAHTDWAPALDRAQDVYLAVFQQLLHYSPVILIVRASIITELRLRLSELFTSYPFSVFLFVADYNDTWARDFGPIGIEQNGQAAMMDFEFNGWGNKFDAGLDNLLTQSLAEAKVLDASKLQQSSLVLEGGAIESNGEGYVLTTSQCLLNDNRNPTYDCAAIEKSLKDLLGAEKILWLDDGYLAGDDTDSHIDTLARFVARDTIAYIKCDDKDDEHYPALNKMQTQLEAFRTADGKPFTLLPLPWPSAKYDADGERLPATYANFLISNGVVLVPTYEDEKDALALSQLTLAFPEHTVVGINCLALIEQHGSLHCISMHLLRGVINFEKFD